MFCFFKFDDGFCVFFWGDGGMGGCCFQPVKFNVFLACSVFCNVMCTGQNVFTVLCTHSCLAWACPRLNHNQHTIQILGYNKQILG